MKESGECNAKEGVDAQSLGGRVTVVARVTLVAVELGVALAEEAVGSEERVLLVAELAERAGLDCPRKLFSERKFWK